ncbi:MAG: sel1 repeat family protein [Rhodocyclaceae bacterium]|nr:MAG: sel1 repeat family protein [Rhodocyclaceae bacterium]
MKLATVIGIMGVLLIFPGAAADLKGGVGPSTPIDDGRSLTALRRAAASGNAEAQRRLGFRYYHGEGIAQDNAQAVALFEKAAAGGDTESASNLGRMYEFGMGVKQDDHRAAEWYRRAAELGEPSSQFRLSVMYYQGQGVARDRVEAAKWWNLAMAQGGEFTARIRASVESAEGKLTLEEIAEGKQRAALWLKLGNGKQ